MTFLEFLPYYLRGLWMMIRQLLPFLPFAIVAAAIGTRAWVRTIPREFR